MFTQAQAPAVQSPTFLNKVFGYFGIAILMSAVGVFYAPAFLPPSAYNIALILELVLIFTSGMWSQKRPLNIILFATFAFLTGVTVVPLLAMANAVGGAALIYKALFATTGMFLGAATYGFITKRNLMGMRGFLITGLIGLIIVGILQIFFYSSTVELISSGVGVLLFSGFIAYDIQKLKYYPENMALEAALSLYLSFFNLFISVLRLMTALGRN